MSLLDTILKRRSIREYTDEEIPKEKLDKILQAGLLAPTSRNRKPCKFFVVKNKEILKKLSESKESGSKMLENANTAIIICANTNTADTWIEDSSIALAYMDLMANELNIGSCWCQSHLRFSKNGENSEKVIKNILSIEDKYRIVGMLSLGISKKELKGHELSEIDETKVTYIN